MAASTPRVHFTIAGDLTVSLRKFMKPAFPKKSFQSTTVVTLIVGDQSVEFRLCGAAVRLQAETSGSATVRLPWRQFEPVVRERFDKDNRVSFAFETGAFTLNKITSRSPQIEIEYAAESNATPPSLAMAAHVRSDPEDVDGVLGLPLLNAYRHTRLHGIQPTLANRQLLREQSQVEQLINEAVIVLTPLGVRRSDLEPILDSKAGISRFPKALTP